MASQAATLGVHFHDSVNINILPPLQQNVDPRWDESLADPYINVSLGHSNQYASANSDATAFHKIFLRSRPRFRGITQIGLAHFHLALGIVLNFLGHKLYTWYSYIVFWGPPVMICSGFLAVAANSIASSKMIRVCNVFHIFSILVSVAGIVLSAIDSFRIYPCGSDCGDLGAIAVTSFVIMTNLLQLNLSSYILHYGFQALNSIAERPPQMRANDNFGFVLPDPPVYSEATFQEPPPYPQSPPFPPPPPYPCSLSTSSLPPFSELIDYSQPPPYSE